jgi:hypothetical protein
MEVAYTKIKFPGKNGIAAQNTLKVHQTVQFPNVQRVKKLFLSLRHEPS